MPGDCCHRRICLENNVGPMLGGRQLMSDAIQIDLWLGEKNQKSARMNKISALAEEAGSPVGVCCGVAERERIV